ncbi:hypothetical protein ABZ990_17040 [Streptomyces sp. NPDC046203]|uniref:hypothetical protein n=1 Tax=Streptomyces sp. NPDC046203 TaxID=3154602 RepID=UPI0033FEC3F7
MKTVRMGEQVTFTQGRLGKMLTQEKAQDERMPIKGLLLMLGFDTPKVLTKYGSTQREAERAALSEVERFTRSGAKVFAPPSPHRHAARSLIGRDRDL